MKKLRLFLWALGVILLASCGSKTPLESVEGRWVLEREGTYIGVNINPDGNGSIDISGRDDYGKNHLILREDTRITEDGNDLYFTFENGTQAHFYIKDDCLYSNDGQPFRKVK